MEMFQGIVPGNSVNPWWKFFSYSKVNFLNYLWLMYYYFFHIYIIKTSFMLKLHINTVSKNFQSYGELYSGYGDGCYSDFENWGCREKRWARRKYYGSDFIVFGGRCQEEGKFFMEIIQDCRMVTFYEVISRRVHLGTVFGTDGHLFLS